MLRKHLTPPKLFSDFNTLQFASVMAMVVFVLLLFYMTAPRHHYGTSIDLPRVLNPASLPGADREDAMKVSITRDGKVYFGTEHVDATNLSEKLAECLKDRGVERKVYILADMRVRWGTIKPVLESVHRAGILRVAFLVYERRPSIFHG